MKFSTTAADERVLYVAFNDDALSVALRDGRVISVPLVWYPRLLNATPTQRKNWKIAGGGYGIHWPDMDEDLSTEGLLRGAPASKMSILAIGHNLTLRERELAHYIVEGLTNMEIAAQLNISLESVRALVRRVFRKLGTSNRVTAKELLLRRAGGGDQNST
jgi:DNA-binding CsgD family transcriptional regulator